MSSPPRPARDTGTEPTLMETGLCGLTFLPAALGGSPTASLVADATDYGRARTVCVDDTIVLSQAFH